MSSRERRALAALALTGWTTVGTTTFGFVGLSVSLFIGTVACVFIRKKRGKVQVTEVEHPKTLADFHLILPEGFKYENLPDASEGCLEMGAYTEIEEAARMARAAGTRYIITCNGGGKPYGYIHTNVLYDMAKELPERKGEVTLSSDTSVWRARRGGVMIPQGRWQTVGGWICDITGWGILKEAHLRHENWLITIKKGRGRGYRVTLSKDLRDGALKESRAV